MLRGRLWGRRRWAWVADSVILALCVAVLLSPQTSTAGRWLVLGLVGLRLLTAGFLVWAWRAQRRAADHARND